ncbi:hypothetical protein RD149_21925 [Gordonia westfalica]|uniref:FAD binding domain-containing protein n=1 Tax=Gordonia westfalica TaxID=158898 RepID=A0ABU2GY60_9ACTN|nr:hypothetical protein [Gordonia westfalica]MDS1116407.1 hypothetical protein [Gordonia westfalica]
MTTPDHGIAAALEAALPHRVHRPDSAGYRDSLARIFFPDASRRRPPCVVAPRDSADVSAALRLASAHGGTVTVRGGGLRSPCVDDGADLWWAVRGGAPSFGVVTEAVMRTHEQGPVHVDRAVVELDALPHYFAIAPTLPRHTTMGAVLGYAEGAAEPAVLVYTACRSGRRADLAEAREATDAVADGLADAIRSAPTRACRIDFQHTGGALADVDEGATAFWGRSAEWNVPLNAIWSDDPDSGLHADSDSCLAWARNTLGVLAGNNYPRDIPPRDRPLGRDPPPLFSHPQS